MMSRNNLTRDIKNTIELIGIDLKFSIQRQFCEILELFVEIFMQLERSRPSIVHELIDTHQT